MKAKVVDINGKEVKDLDLNDNVFNIEPNETVIYESVKNELANKRQGNASTKTKGEVAGTGAKPWKQKGLGRARVGTRQNPVWTGGGVAFGPKPRDYSYKIPKKMKNLAYRSLLSMKNKNQSILLVEDIKLENGKTKELKVIIDQLAKEEKVCLITGDNEYDVLVKRAGRNMAKVKCLSFNRMNIHDIFYCTKVVLTEDAVNNLNTFLDKKN